MVHSVPVRWWARLVWVIVGFVVPLIAIYNIYVWTQPVHHDLSDINTVLFGLFLGFVAGVVGACIAVAVTRKRVG